MVADVPWFISNKILHGDLQVLYIKDFIKPRSNDHYQKLENRSNSLVVPLHSLLVATTPESRILKKSWPINLIK